MALNPETYHEFERQLELQQKADNPESGKAKVKVDEDGTEYEWDVEKKAWFPKLSVDLMLKYQGNYGTTQSGGQESVHSYVDPATKVTFLWNTEKNRWEPKANEDGTPCRYVHPNGSAYIWSLENAKWELDPSTKSSISQGDAAGSKGSNEASSHEYIDPSSGIAYKWDQKRNLWVAENGQVMQPYSHNAIGSTSYTDPKSGLIYNWNKEKGEWIAEKGDKSKKKSEKAKKDPNKRKASQPAWFEASENSNTNVYVEGLPPDISLQEFEELMTKCGIIMTNPHTGKPKLKLYKDNHGNLKGDGLCCYLKKESLDLAVQLLDESTIRGGYKIKVQKASFELKGSYDPSKKPKMLSKKEKAQIKKQNQVLLDWKLARKEGLKKSERVIIFKNMFDPKEFEEDATLITDIRDDLRRECEKFGHVKKVIVFDRHPGGVCSVAFKDYDEATACMNAMNGRWFAQKKIECSAWDGVTDYQVEETDKEREERMKNWKNFLNKDDDSAKNEESDNNVKGES